MEAIVKLARYPLSYEEVLLLHANAYLNAVRTACEALDFSELFEVAAWSNEGKRTRIEVDLETLENGGKRKLASEVRKLVRDACDRLFSEGATAGAVQSLDPIVLTECYKRALRGEIENPRTVFLIRKAFGLQYREAEERILKAQSEEDWKKWGSRLQAIRRHAPEGSSARSRAKAFLLVGEELEKEAYYEVFMQAKASGDAKALCESIDHAEPWWKAQAIGAALDFLESHPDPKEVGYLVYKAWQKSERESDCHLRAAKLVFRLKEEEHDDGRGFINANLSLSRNEEPGLVLLMVELGLGLPWEKHVEDPLLSRLKELANYHWSVNTPKLSKSPKAIELKRRIVESAKDMLETIMGDNDTARLNRIQREYGGFIEDMDRRFHLRFLRTIERLANKGVRKD